MAKSLHHPARNRVIVSLLMGILAGILVASTSHTYLAPLIGWDVTAITYLLLTWPVIWPLDEDQTEKHSLVEDPTRNTAHSLVLLAAIASLAAVGLVLSRDQTDGSGQKFLLALLCIGSVVLSWIIVHTLYTLHYAVMYFTDKDKIIDFNEDAKPAYSDFAYLAFTIGMTFQVSDTIFRNRKVRKVALIHALFSYLFGTVIVATMINLIAGLR